MRKAEGIYQMREKKNPKTEIYMIILTAHITNKHVHSIVLGENLITELLVNVIVKL